jgi:tRNA threonylcarbamoyladenosine biosynthesis protein TsaE
MPNSNENSLVYGLENLQKAASWLLTKIGSNRIVCFTGQMGAGKTSLIAAIVKELGVLEPISSPTFSLVNEYKGLDGKTIYHFDFYRINSLEEVYDIGYEDYFESGALCLIEWPEKIEELLAKENCLYFNIEGMDLERKLSLLVS